jgi:GDP/UDP-N,N'-diacetylbacillosamine 2-epimerase (hydrolysing)
MSSLATKTGKQKTRSNGHVVRDEPRKKVLVVTGSRAEYGLLRPVMDAIQKSPRLELAVIATGMHLVEWHGMSVNEIEAHGFRIDDRVPMEPRDDSGEGMADAVGRGVQGLSAAIGRVHPDVMLVLGDRMEVLAAVIAAACMNVPIAHLHGGDASRGGLDESARHAVTKFAHLHFPATKKSAQRILKMGEDPWRVHVVGAPGLDSILGAKPLARGELGARLGVDIAAPYALMVQHAVTSEPELAGEQTRETLEALLASELPTMIIYPNYDAGGQAIVKTIEEYRSVSRFRIFKNLDHGVYLSLMKHASVLVGNSSSGVIESSSFGVPVVNVGIRQEGRERSTNVIDAPAQRRAILAAIRRATSPAFRRIAQRARNPYGDGRAGVRVAEVLAGVRFDKRLLQKSISFEGTKRRPG